MLCVQLWGLEEEREVCAYVSGLWVRKSRKDVEISDASYDAHLEPVSAHSTQCVRFLWLYRILTVSMHALSKRKVATAP